MKTQPQTYNQHLILRLARATLGIVAIGIFAAVVWWLASVAANFPQ